MSWFMGACNRDDSCSFIKIEYTRNWRIVSCTIAKDNEYRAFEVWSCQCGNMRQVRSSWCLGVSRAGEFAMTRRSDDLNGLRIPRLATWQLRVSAASCVVQVSLGRSSSDSYSHCSLHQSLRNNAQRRDLDLYGSRKSADCS